MAEKQTGTERQELSARERLRNAVAGAMGVAAVALAPEAGAEDLRLAASRDNGTTEQVDPKIAAEAVRIRGYLDECIAEYADGLEGIRNLKKNPDSG